MRGFIYSIVCLVVIKSVLTIIIPEGRMKNFSLSMVNVLMFFNIVNEIFEFFNLM